MAAKAALPRVRVDKKLKDEAGSVLAAHGLTLTDLVRLTLARVAEDKKLPFELRPNETTRAAMEEADEIVRRRQA